MNLKEKKAFAEKLDNVYCGILSNYPDFKDGEKKNIIYDFSCLEYKELISKYSIDKIAGKGTDFVRAKRLLKYLSPRLTHNGMYDNHIECNSLKLLDYSFNNPKQGINCLNKSKILAECCLALGIYARRVVILPYSPYDFDNYVVVEIFDKKMNKWIMLDPTTNGFFVDEKMMPLSMPEIRNKFSNLEFLTFVNTSKSIKDLKKLKEKNFDFNNYICKNCFCFMLEEYNGFGQKGKNLFFIPEGYSFIKNQILNNKYRLQNMPEELKGKYADYLRKVIANLEKEVDHPNNIDSMIDPPLENKHI